MELEELNVVVEHVLGDTTVALNKESESVNATAKPVAPAYSYLLLLTPAYVFATIKMCGMGGVAMAM